MKNFKTNLLAIVTLLSVQICTAQAQHSVGGTFGIGPAFTSGLSYNFTFTAEYKYLLMDDRLGVGAKIGIVNYGASRFGVGTTGFLGAASVDYFFLTEKWKPYASFDLGATATAFGAAFYMSPGGGTRFAILEKLDLDGALRFPIGISGAAGAGVLAGMTINLGAHYRF